MGYFKRKLQAGARILAIPEVKNNAAYLKTLVAFLVGSRLRSSQKLETFKSLGFEQKKLDAMVVNLQRLVKIFLLGAAVAAAYTLYSLVKGHFLAALASFSVFTLFLSQAFRHHFWLFQIRRKKLGCTWREWSHYLMRGDRA